MLGRDNAVPADWLMERVSTIGTNRGTDRVCAFAAEHEGHYGGCAARPSEARAESRRGADWWWRLRSRSGSLLWKASSSFQRST